MIFTNYSEVEKEWSGLIRRNKKIRNITFEQGYKVRITDAITYYR